jgi:hypothetical protein
MKCLHVMDNFIFLLHTGGDPGYEVAYDILIFFVLMLRRPPFCYKNLVYLRPRAPIDQYIARRSEHEKNFKY